MPVRYAEAVGLPPLWVQLLFVLSPAIIMVPLQWHSLVAITASLAHLYSCWVFHCCWIGLFSLGLLYGTVSKRQSMTSHPIWVTLMEHFVVSEIASRGGMLYWLAGGCLVMQVNL